MSSLIDEDGVRHSTMAGMSSVVNSFYQSLFNSEGGGDVDDVFDGWSKELTLSQQQDLSRVYTSGEVETALAQMAPYKAPGIDGLPPGFYQQFWGDVGEDVVTYVLKFLNSQGSIREVNKTLICLIRR